MDAMSGPSYGSGPLAPPRRALRAPPVAGPASDAGRLEGTR
jgi:hypothetical protein